MTSTALTGHDRYAALRFRDFRLLSLGRFVATLGEQMVSVAIGWELYERTGSEFALGLVGLVYILPMLLLSLFAGHVADRFNRKRIVLRTQVLLAGCSLGLALLSFTQGSLWLVYGCLLLIGILRAFNGPAASVLLPQTVDPAAFSSAATWSSSVWQAAAVIGPALGGVLIGVYKSAGLIYLIDVFTGLFLVSMLVLIRGREIALSKEAMSLRSLLAGFGFIRNTRVMMGAATLDMMAVLFGSSVALLPVYAKDILQVGPEGLGLMRTIPSIGAMVMVSILTYLPPFRQAGKKLLWAVAGFGVVTIIFGLSQSFPLSLLMLALMGALDNISVVIRNTLVLTVTPDEMRGRVSAMNGLFIGTSNELGAFESGTVAGFFGPVFSVVSGGVGAIIVVLLVARKWPEILRMDRLSEVGKDVVNG